MPIKYRPELDGLRAIAVLFVIFYHAEINLFNIINFNGGFIGVDIFFVISGYLITSIILKELIYKNKFSFVDFYKRRIRRIVPVLLTVIIVSLPFAWFILLPQTFIKFIKSILFTLGLSSNYFFHFTDLAYFQNVGEVSPLLHTWSLSIEEQFYIFFPFFLFISFKYLKNYVGLILIKTFFISLLLAEWASVNHPGINFYSLPTRAWELIAGSIIAYYEVNYAKKLINKKYNLILTSFGIFLIFFSLFFFNSDFAHPSFLTLVPVLGVCLVILFSYKNNFFTLILSSNLLVKIGLISYSLYLWHYPIFIFLKFKYMYLSTTTQITGIILSFFLSFLSYIYVEKFFKNNFNFKKLIYSIFFLYFLILCFSILVLNYKEKFNDLNKINNYFFFDTKNFISERHNFIKNYNFNNFDSRENVLIIGNSYAEDLLNIFARNEKLNKQYYFYIPFQLNHKNVVNYDFNCFLNFIKTKDINCKNFKYDNLIKQYQESNIIIFHQLDNSQYLKKSEIINQIIKRDNKKVIFFLNNIHDKYLNNLTLLERYVYVNKKLPAGDDLEFIEKNLYLDSENFQKDIILELKQEFKENKINFLLRKDFYCDVKNKKCPVLTKNKNKIYLDFGHISNYGAEYFSEKIFKILEF